MKEPKFIVVIGTSAGGMNALIEFVSHIPATIDAAFFVVMHLSRTSISDFLVHRLQPYTNLHCEVAKEEQSIEKGKIYVAGPNKHLIVKANSIILGKGPEENNWRPSIDVLFRSAAAVYSTRVIGVILTGSLSDGTVGMLAIKRSGGTLIVQDPNEAEYPDMPLSVLDNMEVDFCLPLNQMAETITTISDSTPKDLPAPDDIILEAEIAKRVMIDYENLKQLGETSIYACPDCGGGLWEIKHGAGKSPRYRCHIGHAYTTNDLIMRQTETLESTLWIALRMMEERRNLLKKMEKEYHHKGLSIMSESYGEKAGDIQFHIDKIKEVLYDTEKDR